MMHVSVAVDQVQTVQAMEIFLTLYPVVAQIAVGQVIVCLWIHFLAVFALAVSHMNWCIESDFVPILGGSGGLSTILNSLGNRGSGGNSGNSGGPSLTDIFLGGQGGATSTRGGFGGNDRNDYNDRRQQPAQPAPADGAGSSRGSEILSGLTSFLGKYLRLVFQYNLFSHIIIRLLTKIRLNFDFARSTVGQFIGEKRSVW